MGNQPFYYCYECLTFENPKKKKIMEKI